MLTKPKAIPLSFRIRTVRTEEQLYKAISLRSSAYERHWPNLANSLQQPERQDRNPHSIIFLAESKNDSTPLGTLRIDTNLDSDIPISNDITSHHLFDGRLIAYVTRLGVRQGKLGTIVKFSLFKALYRYCLAKQFHWILVGVRPPSDREYKKMGFQEIATTGELVAIRSSGGIPVRLMAFDVVSGEREWHFSGHPLYKFMCVDYHPDIEIFSSVAGIWGQSRQRESNSITNSYNDSELGIPLI